MLHLHISCKVSLHSQIWLDPQYFLWDLLIDWHLFGAKPLPEPVMTCVIGPLKISFSEI